jgi:hypothetical protein
MVMIGEYVVCVPGMPQDFSDQLRILGPLLRGRFCSWLPLHPQEEWSSLLYSSLALNSPMGVMSASPNVGVQAHECGGLTSFVSLCLAHMG